MAALLIPTAALGIGSPEAIWIRQGVYLAFNGMHCCGERDCEPAPEGAIIEVPEGYEIVGTGQIIPLSTYGRGLHWSIDNRFWWCRNMARAPEYQVHCLFVPGVGF